MGLAGSVIPAAINFCVPIFAYLFQVGQTNQDEKWVWKYYFCADTLSCKANGVRKGTLPRCHANSLDSLFSLELCIAGFNKWGMSCE